MSDRAQRVRYAEGQRLRADDLRAEQEYLIALERSHNLAQHAPGIVQGLDAYEDWRHRAVIRAGVAVDDGTLIVLDETTSVASEAPQCLDAWLIRCESPFRLRHPGRGACEFDRVREQVRVITIPVAANADPVPPIAGAVYLGRSVCSNKRDRAFTAITAANVDDPNQRAAMQVGPANGRDRNGFLLTTLGQPRISLDRLGTNRFHGNVTLSGYRASAVITVSATQRLLVQARRPGIGGEQIHIRVRPDKQDPNSPKLRLQFFDGLRKSERDLLLPKGAGLEQAVKAFNSELVTVALKKTPNRKPFPFGGLFRPLVKNMLLEAPEPEAPQAEEPDPFDVSADLTLRARGGSLELQDWPATVANEPVRIRGCYQKSASDEDAVKGVNGLTFIAMKKAAEAPPTPGAWSVETGTPAEPRQELRLDLGAKKDGDVSIRYSLGSIGLDDAYGDWLTLNGSGLATLPHLKVEGTIEVAPIKPDHTDKNFTDLLVRAWMDGLQAAIEASTVVDVTFNGLPALIRTGDAWNYSVTIDNSSEVPIIADKILETRTITGLPAPLTKVISQQVNIDVGKQANINVAHPADETPAGMMSIEIRVSGKIGNASWWRARTTDADIPVVESPTIDPAGIPDSVPRGLPWSYSFDVQNNSQAAVSVQSVFVKEGANAAVAQPGTPMNLAAQSHATFTPPQHAGMNNDLQHLTLTANFVWPADNSASSVVLDRTVRARNDLSANIVRTEDPAVNTAWSYNLDLSNVSTRGLTLLSIAQHIHSVENLFADTAPQQVAFAPNFDIPADGVTFAVDAPLVPAQTGHIDVVLDIEYERNDDGRRFTIREDRRFDVT